MQERTVPFLITAAGNRAEMFRGVVRGLNVEYELLSQNGLPAFLEWHELLAEAAKMAPEARVSREQQVIVADVATQFFQELFAAIDAVDSLRKKDDRKIILFNGLIDLARRGQEDQIENACGAEEVGMEATRNVLETIGWYRGKIDANVFTGAAVARGYRTFLLQPGGRGAHRYFTGVSQSRPSQRTGRLRYRNVARYFTPTEVIQQMVRLAQPRSNEKVIDMTSGSGGFLAECVNHVARAEGDGQAQNFLTERLVGIDDDPFCVSCSRALLSLLYPQHSNRLLVFLHNCLYTRAPRHSEVDETPAAEPHLQPGTYDLVIGNPPGNNEYSGTNRAEIVRQWRQRFGHTEGGLMDHHCFVRRAIDLARPDGGRVCLLVPEGLLARDNRGMPELRQEFARECDLRAVISLPRVFKENNARMSVLYLTRTMRPNPNRKVVVAEILETWIDARNDRHTTDLFGELESIVDECV